MRICLNMIVKDEAHIIEETLNSIKDYICFWVISDTGSTDGTQEFINDLRNDPSARPQEAVIDEVKAAFINRARSCMQQNEGRLPAPAPPAEAPGQCWPGTPRG